MTTTDASLARSLAPAIRASLDAKLERLLARPIIAAVLGTSAAAEQHSDDVPSAFRALRIAAQEHQPTAPALSGEDPDDGTFTVRIAIDYDEKWRDCEKEVREAVLNTIDGAVTFLTERQKLLLERSPREFLELSPPPETAELISFEMENVGGSLRVVELKLAKAPESRGHVRHLAVVPNLVQIQRQLEALHCVETASDDGPHAPLRALIGACDPSKLRIARCPATIDDGTGDKRLDEHQRECIEKATATPHFAVIEGPPGSGKTTVIAEIIRRALARGERVLVVSPTHVAVDNVVEKLVEERAGDEDQFEVRSLPVRYSARPNKLSKRALEYWVGAKKEHRDATIARRVQSRMSEKVPLAKELFSRIDENASAHAPISSALARVESVICGTPIGLLSFEAVKNAPTSFDLLIVDEVSKMTMSEFLAIAVKARRWVVVGDPAQLPPYNNCEENGTVLDEIVPPLLELACSVGALYERPRPEARRNERVVVVSSQPVRVAAAIQAHLRGLFPGDALSVGLIDSDKATGIVVCSVDDAERAFDRLARSDDGSLANTSSKPPVRTLVERGLEVVRPGFASGRNLVDARERAHALIFETSFKLYHTLPWGSRSGQRLRSLRCRNGLTKYLPSVTALDALRTGVDPTLTTSERHREMMEAIAMRFAVNTVSLYDWLTGIPSAPFDTSPLRELSALVSPSLCEAVRPFVGTLKMQYRMHASLSRVPRELFYFGEALHDGKSDPQAGSVVLLRQVDSDGEEGESNGAEVAAIVELVQRLSSEDDAKRVRRRIMVITPYSKQEARLTEAFSRREIREKTDNVEIEPCTLDRCQGREAEYVFVSLVRSRATAFFDLPKRWNVALTRAREGLVIVGNVNAYLAEAARARHELNAHSWGGNGHVRAGEKRPLMSLLARIIEAYDHQSRASTPPYALEVPQ